jgi:N-acetylglucosaminyldiphosphoundecaprenol N-acetyl-beta-D-mannosaminyltransferase
MEEARVLGIKVHPVNMDQAVQTIASYVQERGPHLVVTVGTEMVMAAQEDEAFRGAIESASLVVPDGVGVVWASRRKGFTLEKVAGIELMARLLETAAAKGWRVFLLGAGEGIATAAADVFRQKWPGLQVVGAHSGYFQDEGLVLEQIKTARPDLLFLALGAPRQELFYRRHPELDVPVGMGVGGSFDVYAGKIKRAPRWMIRLGLEWMWRLYLEPSRWRRQLALPRFVFKVLAEDR